MDGWVENRLFGHEIRNREDWPDNEMYHTYHADRQKVPPPTKPKPGKPKDAVHLFSTDRNEYEYAVVHNALPDSKPHRIRSLTRRHGNREAFDRGSDSESEWSSLERRQREVYNKANRKPTLHKKTRKKRGIPVAPPRIPSFEAPPLPPFPGGQRTQSLDPLDKGIEACSNLF
ncbi:hypothetical protein JTE90_016749 [Oedothorax gibbosus]|uniref:Uncharacterized protein n=1 Tax=Oedothorax gibbosus TaxID=931172 RepID=A0AAV6VZ01_9ARAC|nr:hypothetical protein JTE90_016749 [Oedothorax gibbosus]